MIELTIGACFFVVAFFICLAVFPSKKYMSDIYQELYLKQDKQTKMISDMRNVFFAQKRAVKKGGK